MGFTCVGSANLRFLIKVAYTPTSAEVLTMRLKIMHADSCLRLLCGYVQSITGDGARWVRRANGLPY